MASDPVILHETSMFKMPMGFSYYDVVIPELTFEKHDNTEVEVCNLDIASSFGDNKFKNPVVADLKQKIEEHYGVIVRKITVLYFPNGDAFMPTYKDNDIYKGKGTFVVSLGESRMFMSKKGSKTQRYMLNDGDLIFYNSSFDNENSHCMPHIRGLDKPAIILLFFI